MQPTRADDATRRVILTAQTAEDLLTPNPVSIHEQATLREAAAVLTDREIGAVPVINEGPPRRGDKPDRYRPP